MKRLGPFLFSTWAVCGCRSVSVNVAGRFVVASIRTGNPNQPSILSCTWGSLS